MLFIVIFYWPLTLTIESQANIFTKFILFVLFPLISLFFIFKIKNLKTRNKIGFDVNQFGISSYGLKKSLRLGFIFLPLMLIVTFFVKFLMGGTFESNLILGIFSFIESFSEEFFFRGILFLFLMYKTNFKVAYITSLASFILLHPQNFFNPFIISTIIQGFITLEICRRSKNITGAWLVHGSNRFFSIALYPFML